MKDIYIVLDYSACEKDRTAVMTSFLKGYVGFKNSAADRAKWFSRLRRPSDKGFVANMQDSKTALRAAIQFIQVRLWSYMTNNIKILVAGHGQVDQNEGIVRGGAKGTEVGVSNEEIANHILSITKPFSNYWINWRISLCICYAGRPTENSTSTIGPQSAFRSSMSGKLAELLQSKQLRNFQLKANFTPVSVGRDGHIHARSEHSQQKSFALAKLDSEARKLYPVGFEFWNNNDDEMERWSQLFSFAFAAGSYTLATAMTTSAQEKLKQDFLVFAHDFAFKAEAEDQEFYFRVIAHNFLDQILNYRLVDVLERTFAPNTIQTANKVIWTCVNGKLSHSLVLREA